MENNEFRRIITRLDEKVRQLELEEENFQNRILAVINLCANAYNELREAVLKFGLNSSEEEIEFFKHTKSYVVGEYLYHSKLFEIETKKPVTSIKDQKKFLKKMISQVRQFFNENQEFYHYYRSGSEHLDDKYFVRTKTICCIHPHHFIIDLSFSTSHDYTLAAIKAYEKIIEYCKTEIAGLRVIKFPFISQKDPPLIKTSLTWTEKKRALIELIYGIYYSCAVNNGKVEIKELIRAFEAIFNIRLSGFYHTWGEIRLRKTGRTRYLDFMKECMIKQMDDADGK
jgi:hypothetical protein